MWFEVYISSGFFLHLGVTIYAQDVHILGGPDGLPTAWTDVLAGTGGLLRLGLGVGSSHAARSGNGQLVSPMVVGTE